MMDVVRDDFYVDDEPAADAQRAWESGETVLIIPSRFRRQLARLVRMLRDQVAKELRQAADHVGSSGTGARR